MKFEIHLRICGSERESLSSPIYDWDWNREILAPLHLITGDVICTGWGLYGTASIYRRLLPFSITMMLTFTLLNKTIQTTQHKSQQTKQNKTWKNRENRNQRKTKSKKKATNKLNDSGISDYNSSSSSSSSIAFSHLFR